METCIVVTLETMLRQRWPAYRGGALVDELCDLTYWIIEGDLPNQVAVSNGFAAVELPG